MSKKKALIVVSLCALALLSAAIVLPGCAKKQDAAQATSDTQGRPTRVTAYEVVGFCKPAANKWQDSNWMIQVRDGDQDGLGRDGKAKIWEVYFFSPTPEESTQLLVEYNRGYVWPSAPTANKGGDDGRAIYAKGKPPDFRVDSPEVYTVGLRNGGGDYLDAHPDAQVHAALRCKADYDAISETMPAPKYKWVWDVTYRVPQAGAETLHIYVDGMNGDFIAKELKKPPA